MVRRNVTPAVAENGRPAAGHRVGGSGLLGRAKVIRTVTLCRMKRRKSSAEPGGPVITPSNAKRALAVGKILAPALLPVAVRAAGVARGAWDEHKARRLGVAPGELAKYSGRGGALHARVSRVAQALAELQASGEHTEQVTAFVTEVEPRLVDLTAAIRAAELMPTERRRAAYRAVGTELDRIEPRLLDLLGVNSRPLSG